MIDEVRVQTLSMADIKDFGRDDHGQPAARSEQRERGNNKRHRSVGMLRKGQPKARKDLFCQDLLLLGQNW